MVRGLTLSGLLLTLAMISGGCPVGGTGSGGGLGLAGLDLNGSGNNAVGEIIEAQATAPTGAGAGQTVTLAGGVIADGDGSSATYRWFQTAGRVVALLNADTEVVSFEAPSLPSAATLRFRLDATLAGQTRSAEVSVVIDADPNFGVDPNQGGGVDNADPFPQVLLKTSKGEIVVELNRDKAPISVENFLKYVDSGHYNNTIFHRVMPGFVVQGGGFEADLTEKPVRAPIVNESTNGLKNARGTLAMARQNAPNSATAQFYFNLVNNTSLDRTETSAGYAVFGKVIKGLDVVDDIAEVETGSENGFDDVPVEDVILTRAERTSGVTP